LAIVDNDTLLIDRIDGPPLRLTADDDAARLACRVAGRRVLVRATASSTGSRMVELMSMPVVDAPHTPWRVGCSQEVLEREGRRLRVRTSQVLRGLRQEFIFRKGSDQLMLARTWADGNWELLGADGRWADLVERESGPIIVRIRAERASSGEGTNLHLVRGIFVLHEQGEASPRPVPRLGLNGLPLLPVYEAALLGEVRELALNVLQKPVMEIDRIPDPDSGLPHWYLKEASGVESVVLISRAESGQFLSRIRRCLNVQGSNHERLGVLLDELNRSGLRPVGVLERGRLETSTGSGSIDAEMVALNLDYRARVQATRRHVALLDVRRERPEGPLAVMLGMNASPSYLRRTQPPSLQKIAAAMGVMPTPAQARAIALAVTTPDVVLIQGPPGTGKTRVIAAIRSLLADQSRHGVAATVLLTGTQHEAVDNLVATHLRQEILPAARFKGKGQTFQMQLAQWSGQWMQRLGPQTDEELHPDVPAEVARLHTLALSRGARELPAIRTSLRRILTGVLPGERIAHLLNELTPPTVQDVPEDVLDLLRLVRTERVAFNDDGRFTLVRLLQTPGFPPLLQEAERALIEQVLEQEKSPSKEQLKGLEQMQRRILRFRESNDLPANARRALLQLEEDLEDYRLEQIGEVQETLARLTEALADDTHAVKGLVERFSDAKAATCQVAGQAAASHGDKGAQETLFETVIIDEASRTPPADVLVAGRRARRRIIVVGDHKQLPHFIDESIRDYLDERQLAAYSKPLFEGLIPHLSRLARRDGRERVVALTDQFRMHPRLGDFVSSTFYEPDVRLNSPRPEADFEDVIPLFGRRVALWRDVPSGLADRSFGSWSRPAEAEDIRDFVGSLLRADSGLTIGVLTFYAAQRSLIEQALVDAGEWDDDHQLIPTLNPQGKPDRLWVGTVDAAQGREFDCVAISMVRSSSTPDQRYGHLSDANRMCVAMSRARRGLAVVGDRRHYIHTKAEAKVPWIRRFLALCDEEDLRCT
jgi:hypothetical protein